MITGCVQQYGEQSYNIGRNAWLQAGLPIETPATTIDRQCGSAQQAVNFAAALVASGVHDVAIGGGVEHMGHIPLSVNGKLHEELGSPFPPELLERHPIVHQGLSAELIAEQWNISREECDEIALRSQQRAARATETRAGSTARPCRSASTATCPRPTRGFARRRRSRVSPTLKPAFKEDGLVTAGNSSQVSDGACGRAAHGARAGQTSSASTPRARIVDQTTVGVDPVLMLTGPIPATRKILERNGMTIDDLDLIEINEAFASVIAAWERELEPDVDKVNVNGGAIALGHPLGSTGARLITTLLHELERRDGELGLVTMCCGGGLGTATLIERSVTRT